MVLAYPPNPSSYKVQCQQENRKTDPLRRISFHNGGEKKGEKKKKGGGGGGLARTHTDSLSLSLSLSLCASHPLTQAHAHTLTETPHTHTYSYTQIPAGTPPKGTQTQSNFLLPGCFPCLCNCGWVYRLAKCKGALGECTDVSVTLRDTP
jgi:hypothetical protein